jgi:DNA modification methylase
VITSPPYLGLRDYGVKGQIGLEVSPREYIKKMVMLFREIRRVLRKDGTCWINMGDSYAGSGNYRGVDQDSTLSAKQRSNGGARGLSQNLGNQTPEGFKPKDLMMIPARLAIALCDDGWWLRSEIIWSKINPMPESVRDRPTKSHEMVYLLTKSPTYWYDADAIRESLADANAQRTTNHYNTAERYGAGNGGNGGLDSLAAKIRSGDYLTRNKRSVWTVPTEPTPFAHFATFPKALITPMILAGCPDKCCSICGAPWERVTEPTPEYAQMLGKGYNDHSSDLSKGFIKDDTKGRRCTANYITTGFRPTCEHADTPTVPGVVFDPFMGSGTTALTTRSLGRHYIGCDLNPEYVKMANDRLAVPFTPPLFTETGPVDGGEKQVQQEMFGDDVAPGE